MKAKCFVFLILAFMTEIHQELIGHGFDYTQILDGGFHHEHIIIFFTTLFIICMIRGQTK